MKMKRALIWAGVPGLISAVADQWTKRWAVDTLREGRRNISVIEGYFNFRYSENTGSAFGMFRGYGDILTVIGLLALGFVGYLIWNNPDARRRSMFALGLIAGGAVGNLWDRLARGYVVDFIVWHYKSSYYWPAFNIADAALVAGVAMILIWPEKTAEAVDESTKAET